MEVMTIRVVQDKDFDFNSARSSPSPSAPSTPRRFGEYYCSAPSSPSRLSEFYREFDESFDTKTPTRDCSENEDDFAFDVGDYVKEAYSVSAEELFDGGMIKPLKPKNVTSGTRSPNSPVPSQGKKKKMVVNAFSTKHEKESDRSSSAAAGTERERGRQRAQGLSSSSRRATRSLSPPLKVSQYPWEEDEKELLQKPKQATVAAKSSTALTNSPSKGQRKWRLKDFFLFRSASEGRATSDKDPLRKHTASLFRRIDSPSGGGSMSSTSRKGKVSAHELHYTANRAAKQELKKKTFLPYKQGGILGRIAINPWSSFLG